MEIIRYFESDRQMELAEKIGRGDWSAARFLVKLLREGSFHNTLGAEGDVLLLMDGEQLVSFATLSRQDCIADERLYPWLGFLFTFPEYRGQGNAGKLLTYGADLAAKQGHKRVYLATDHVGFYERYGFVYMENRIDVWGEDSRIYYKDIG